MINQIIEYSLQPYMIFWAVLMICLTILAVFTLFTGLGSDFGFDLDLDFDADLEPGSPDASMSFFNGICIFLNLNTIPLTIVLFAMVSLNWLFGFYINRLINPEHNNFIGWLVFTGVFLISFPFTRVFTLPLKKLFKAMVEDKESQTHAIGNFCTTITEVTSKTGQATIKEGPTVVNLMVYADRETIISKGKKAVVLNYDKQKNRYAISEVDDDIFK